MYRVRGSQGKLQLFYRMFIELFCHIFFAVGLNTYWNEVWNYRYIYQRDLSLFKCWSGFCYLLYFCTHDKEWLIWKNIIARASKSRKNCSIKKSDQVSFQPPPPPPSHQSFPEIFSLSSQMSMLEGAQLWRMKIPYWHFPSAWDVT